MKFTRQLFGIREMQGLLKEGQMSCRAKRYLGTCMKG